MNRVAVGLEATELGVKLPSRHNREAAEGLQGWQNQLLRDSVSQVAERGKSQSNAAVGDEAVTLQIALPSEVQNKHQSRIQFWESTMKSFLFATTIVSLLCATLQAEVGVGAKPIDGAEVILDGSREMLDGKWTYWKGPRFASSLPIKWKVVDDPVDGGKCVMTDDPVAAGGKYGTADIVTKEKYRDFRLHVEFYIAKERGNSGVYLQNRYEIQVLDGDKTKHGMGAIINESESPYHLYNGTGTWNSYDVMFRAARFKDGKRVEKANVTLYFNGKKAHTDHPIHKVWGGANSGLDGGNYKGVGITDTPGGLKLQCEGHDVRYRNIWIKKLDIKKPSTDFKEPVAKRSESKRAA